MDVDLTPLLELIGTIIGAMLTVFVPWGFMKMKEKLGIEIEAKHREALHSALATGAEKAKAALAPHAHITINNPAIAEVVDWVVKSTPDAVKHFDLSPHMLEEMAVAKLEKSMNPPVAEPTVPAPPLRRADYVDRSSHLGG